MISVVLCTYNRAPSLRKTLESLRRMPMPPDLAWELLIVDNNSNDSTRDEVSRFAANSDLNVRYIWEPRAGKSYALNRGISEARGEIIAFTDDDVLVSPEWLPELICAFNHFDCLGVGGRCIPGWDSYKKPDWVVTTGPYCLSRGPLLDFDLGSEAKEIQYRDPPWGLNMAFRRIAFEKYGGFRTDLGPSGTGRVLGEDTEFCRRLLGHGEKIVYAPKAVVHHPVHPERISKKYFLRYQFNVGRAEIRLEGWPADAVCYFGIPRYMFRTLLERCKTWLFTVGAEKRFYHKARVYCLLGQMFDARALQNETTDWHTSWPHFLHARGAKLNRSGSGSRDAR
jgi:glycosyltransferase involved in cell wall biosynthesis